MRKNICLTFIFLFLLVMQLSCHADAAQNVQLDETGLKLTAMVKDVLKQYLQRRQFLNLPHIEVPDGVKGVFVTLSVNGKTRGCSGTFSISGRSLSREVRDHAIRAATVDPRYPGILATELLQIRVSITFILSSPKSVDSLDLFHPAYQGVLFKGGGRNLVFLPGERRYPRTLMEEARQTLGTDAVSIFVFQAKRVSEK